jgi:hypothetical protein
LRLTRGGIERKHQVWEWPLPGGAGEVMDVLGAGKHTTVVVRAENMACGLDGTTGRPRWRCIGACPPTGLLQAEDPAAPPLVLFAQKDGATTCRRALEIAPDGRYRLPARETITPAPLPEDPRLRKPSPSWWQLLRELRTADWPSFLPFQVVVFFAFVLGWSAVWVFRRGAWVIGLVLGLLLLAMLGLAAGFVYHRFGDWGPDPMGALNVLLAIVVFGLPTPAYLGQLVSWAVQKRWRRVGWMLAGPALLAVPVAVFWSSEHNPGLFSAWLFSVFGAGVLLVLGRLGWLAFRGVRRVWREVVLFLGWFKVGYGSSA